MTGARILLFLLLFFWKREYSRLIRHHPPRSVFSGEHRILEVRLLEDPSEFHHDDCPLRQIRG